MFVPGLGEWKIKLCSDLNSTYSYYISTRNLVFLVLYCCKSSQNLVAWSNDHILSQFFCGSGVKDSVEWFGSWSLRSSQMLVGAETAGSPSSWGLARASSPSLHLVSGPCHADSPWVSVGSSDCLRDHGGL